MSFSVQSFVPLAEALGKAGLPLLETGFTALVATAGAPYGGGLASAALNKYVFPAINVALGLDADAPPDQAAATVAADPTGAADKLAAVQEEHSFLLQGAKMEADAAATVAAQQQALNLDAQKQDSFFVRGPRPAMLWGLGLLLMLYKGSPWVVWVLTNAGHVLTPPPPMDTDTFYFVAALLGVGYGLRTVEKTQGVAGPARPKK